MSEPQTTVQDPELPRLSLALNAGTMAGEFQKYFEKEYPEHGLAVERCQIERIYHKPGRECAITYRVAGRNQMREVFEQWFHALMLRQGVENFLRKHEAPTTWPGCRFWKPLAAWKAMNMAVFAFPYDPNMPCLGLLLDEAFVKAKIEAHLAAFGLEPGWKCQEVEIEKFKYRAFKSCVLRFRVRFVNARGDSRRAVFFSKTYNSTKSRRVYQVIGQIQAQAGLGKSGGQNGALNIPALIAHLDEANTIWQQEWPGEKLRATGNRMGWENFLKSPLILHVASLLAALQRVPIEKPPLPPGTSPAALLDNVQEHAASILVHLPEKRALLERLLRACAEALSAPTDPLPRRTIHGSFKIAQLLHRDGELALVDFDGIACGDPLYDVGEFLASLLFLRASEGISAQRARQGTEAFLEAYGREVPWPIERRRLAGYIVGFLIGKIHSSLKKAETAAIQNIEAAFAAAEEWSREAGLR